jgi:erythromycin 3''-O-methyltransferase
MTERNHLEVQRGPRDAGHNPGASVWRANPGLLQRLPTLATELLYAMVAPLGKDSRFLNLGYWRDKPSDAHAAGVALVELVAQIAKLRPSTRVLDVGFGLGEQDVFWAERFGPLRILGIDASRSNVRAARARVHAAKLDDSIDLRWGTATRMPIRTNSVDTVLAVESALHFESRPDFFEESYRVLRSGGRLVTADILPIAARRGVVDKLQDVQASLVWQVPLQNFVTHDTYARQLQDAGFQEVELLSIREHVFEPFMAYVQTQLEDPRARSAIPLLWRGYWQAAQRNRRALSAYDYVIASAVKPGLPRARRVDGAHG